MGLRVPRAAISAGFSPCIFLCIVHDADMVCYVFLASFVNFYLFILAALVFTDVHGLLVAVNGSYALVAVLGLLIAVAAFVVDHSLEDVQTSVVAARRVSRLSTDLVVLWHVESS